MAARPGNLTEDLQKERGVRQVAGADLEVSEVAASHDHGLHGHQGDIAGAGDCCVDGNVVGHVGGPDHGSCHIGPAAEQKVRIVPPPLHTSKTLNQFVKATDATLLLGMPAEHPGCTTESLAPE